MTQHVAVRQDTLLSQIENDNIHHQMQFFLDLSL